MSRRPGSPLSPTQAALAAMLSELGRASYAELAETVGIVDYGSRRDNKLLAVHISDLRKKLGLRIPCRTGYGYLWDGPDMHTVPPLTASLARGHFGEPEDPEILALKRQLKAVLAPLREEMRAIDEESRAYAIAARRWPQ